MEKNNNKPKLRFPGFTDPWEQRKLGELSDVYDGTHQTPNYTDSGVMFLSVENIKTLQSEKYISEKDFKKDFKVFPESKDILMTRIGDIGTVNVVESNEPKAYYVSLALLKHKKLDPYFLKESISSETVKKELWHRTLHIAFPKKINKNEIDNVPIPYPKSEEEQHQIGTFFQRFDKLITLHQRKLNHLQDKKKSLLQKTFPKNGEDFPELRFPGFTDPWEQRKLGDIAERITRKNIELESTLPLTISAQYGLVDQITFFNNRVASRDVSGYYLLKKGEFAYNKSYSEGYPWGAVKRLERYENGVLSTLYICFKLSDVNSNFLVSYYDTNNWYKEVAQRAAEGARNHGLLNISADDFFDTKLTIPKFKEEQAAIGCFFQNLDNLITLHQRKLNHLKEQKKSLLQQMFI